MAEVKICGLSTAETMQAALDAGADFVGLNFYPPSPRYVTLEKAAKLAAMARGKTRIVALTVDADDALLESIYEAVKPDLLQLHGDETPERTAQARLPVIKAIKVRKAADVAMARAFSKAAELIMFDAKAPESVADALPGGNGVAFDWDLLKTASGRFLLAGGLTPDNVASAITVTKAPIVDVSSGVESAPGVKDAALIWKFIEAAKVSR
jgi:phosphoribosylanthranilate isomerase